MDRNYGKGAAEEAAAEPNGQTGRDAQPAGAGDAIWGRSGRYGKGEDGAGAIWGERNKRGCANLHHSCSRESTGAGSAISDKTISLRGCRWQLSRPQGGSAGSRGAEWDRAGGIGTRQ